MQVQQQYIVTSILLCPYKYTQKSILSPKYLNCFMYLCSDKLLLTNEMKHFDVKHRSQGSQDIIKLNGEVSPQTTGNSCCHLQSFIK